MFFLSCSDSDLSIRMAESREDLRNTHTHQCMIHGHNRYKEMWSPSAIECLTWEHIYAIFTKAQSAKVNMLPRLDIEAMDLPTILHMIYRMVSVQQTNFVVRDGQIFSKQHHFSLGG